MSKIRERQNSYALVKTVLAWKFTEGQRLRQVLIPGKNWKLSLAELILFLEARRSTLKVLEFSKEFFVIETGNEAGPIDVANLGGTIKVGVVSKTVSTDLLAKAFAEKDRKARSQITEVSSVFAPEASEKTAKVLFGVSVYCSAETLRPVSSSIHRFVGSLIKNELAGQGIRSEFLGFPRSRDQPQLTHVEVLKKKLVERKAEVLLCIGKTQSWLEITSGVHDPFEFQKRDVGKPNQRKIFAIPPRLARIMVNLSGCMSGKVLMDPFCGVGTILQEALLSRAEVIGVDANGWCVDAAVENLEWLRKEYSLGDAEFRVLKGDALRLKSIAGSSVDCIATEPDLGPALKDVPTSTYAQKIADKLSPLYFAFLEQAYGTLRKGGRLVLVTPYFRTRSGKPVAMRIEEKALEIGFEMVYPFGSSEVFESYDSVKHDMRVMRRFVDMAERHKTGREIHVFQK